MSREHAAGTDGDSTREGPPDGGRLIFIVSRRDVDRYDYLKRTFRDEAKVDVVLDRRRGERRWRDLQPPVERRRSDRRKVDTRENLETLGWAMIRQHATAHQIQ